MSIFFITFFFMYFSSIVVFVSQRKHLLIMLLSLEFSVISMYVGLFYLLSMADYEFFFVLVFLTMSVCEGALGLSLLVMMSRVHSNDYIMTFSSLW